MLQGRGEAEEGEGEMARDEGLSNKEEGDYDPHAKMSQIEPWL